MQHRIVSLIPSATEIVCALGARRNLVGVSHECDYPPDVLALPKLTRARISPSQSDSSAGINRSIRGLLESALSVYEIDTELLRRLDPDVIVTQDLCEVCAVSRRDVEAAAAVLTGHPATVVSLEPARLADLWQDIRTTAAAIGLAPVGEELIARLRRELEVVRAQAIAWAGTSRPHGPPLKVVAIEWLDPVMLGGLWMPELIEVAGGECLGIAAGERARTWTRAELARLSPDVVLIKPCGYPLAETLAEIELLPQVLPWDSWPAAAEGRVFVADGNAYFNRPGPRLVDSAAILAACLHPDGRSSVADRYPGAVVRIDPDLTVHAIESRSVHARPGD
jgi:iron complex transport system substrate-binding protein